MNSVYGNFDWSDFEGKDKMKKTCKPEALEKFKNIKNPFSNLKPSELVNAMSALAFFIDSVERAVEGNNFDQVKEP